jgi:hypothetical protein
LERSSFKDDKYYRNELMKQAVTNVNKYIADNNLQPTLLEKNKMMFEEKARIFEANGVE